MMYFLHQLSNNEGPDLLRAFNVFQYITFRAVGAAITAFLLSLVFGNWVIRKLISLKVGQPIRTKEEVNRLFELHGKKAGTPTMGGVLLLGAVLVSTLIWARPDNFAVLLLLFVMLWCGALGFWDDYLKVAKKNAAGVSERTKVVAQLGIAAVVTGFFLLNPAIEVQARALYVPFYKSPIIAESRRVHVLLLRPRHPRRLECRESHRWARWPRHGLHGDHLVRLRGLCLRRGQREDRDLPRHPVLLLCG